MAREFKLAPSDSFSALVVDPFDLLRNKLAIRRPKDEAHIAILKTYLEEELQGQFKSALAARERLGPVVRYLDVLGSPTLSLGLAEKLIPLARELADFRMLAHRIPLELSHALQSRDASEECRQAVERVLVTRMQSNLGK